MKNVNYGSRSARPGQSPYRKLAESPFLWGAVGMIAGATISVLPMRDFFIAGWVLIAWGCIRELRVSRAAIAVLLFGAVLTVFYREVPKPPTTDQLAEAIATRIVVLQSGGRVQLLVPPTGLKATATTSTQAAAVAQKVLELVVKKKQ